MNFIKNKFKKFLNTPLRHLQSKLLFEMRANQLADLALNSNCQGVTDEKYGDVQLIVSLTTFGKRLQDVALSIESIMQGSMKPNKIVLWIDESWRGKRMPIALQRQQERGLEIGYCKDIRSYTKLVPSLRKYPDDVIITIDDDVLYRFDLVERLFGHYLNHPGCIISNRIHRIVLGKDGRPISYLNWKWNANPQDASPLNFLTGVGGVLYPPHSLDDEVTNEEVFLDICKFADDIWFYAMALKKGTQIIKGNTFDINGYDYYWPDQGSSLLNVNVSGECLNDTQLKAVLEKYDLYKKL